MHAVEFEQMRGGGDAAFQLVDVHNVEPVGRARVARRAVDSAECGAQRQPPDPAHAVDTDFHRRAHVVARALSPISSSRALTAIRSSESNGRLTKISSRRLIIA